MEGRYIGQSQRILNNMKSRGGGSFTVIDGAYIFWDRKKWRAYAYERDRKTCLWCGEEVQPRHKTALTHTNTPSRKDYSRYSKHADLDHLRPVSRGGSNSPFNMVTTHACCNFNRMNVDWRVYAQYMRAERRIKETVERLQYDTYLHMDGGHAGRIFHDYALDLYRQALHPIWGAPIDPDTGILDGFTYHHTDLWGVAQQTNSIFASGAPKYGRHLGRHFKALGLPQRFTRL